MEKVDIAAKYKDATGRRYLFDALVVARQRRQMGDPRLHSWLVTFLRRAFEPRGLRASEEWDLLICPHGTVALHGAFEQIKPPDQIDPPTVDDLWYVLASWLDDSATTRILEGG